MGKQIVTASDNGSAKIWDWRAMNMVSLDGHRMWSARPSSAPTARRSSPPAWDGSAKLWDLEGNELASLEGHTDSASTRPIFSPEGRQIVTARR